MHLPDGGGTEVAPRLSRAAASIYLERRRDPPSEIVDCVLLCFVDPILGNRYGPGGHSFSQRSWGGRILTLPLNYVAGYTGPLLFLFERTHNFYAGIRTDFRDKNRAIFSGELFSGEE